MAAIRLDGLQEKTDYDNFLKACQSKGYDTQRRIESLGFRIPPGLVEPLTEIPSKIVKQLYLGMLFSLEDQVRREEEAKEKQSKHEAELRQKLTQIKPYLIPKEVRELDQGEYLQTPQQHEQYRQFSTCINCMLCYAACPQYGMNPDFTGPAILALMHRYNADSRDGGRAQRMELGHADEGVWECTAVGYCSEVCQRQLVEKVFYARDVLRCGIEVNHNQRGHVWSCVYLVTDYVEQVVSA